MNLGELVGCVDELGAHGHRGCQQMSRATEFSVQFLVKIEIKFN